MLVYWPCPITSESVVSLGDNKGKVTQGSIIAIHKSCSNFFCVLFHVLCIWTAHLVSTRHQTSHMSNLHVSPEDSHRPVSKETAVTQTLNKIFCSEQNVSKVIFFLFVLAPSNAESSHSHDNYVTLEQGMFVLSAASCPFHQDLCGNLCEEIILLESTIWSMILFLFTMWWFFFSTWTVVCLIIATQVSVADGLIFHSI